MSDLISGYKVLSEERVLPEYDCSAIDLLLNYFVFAKEIDVI